MLNGVVSQLLTVHLNGGLNMQETPQQGMIEVFGAFSFPLNL